MATISAALRRAVAERAGHCCEYCGLSDEAALAPHEPDHIVGEQHGGETAFENLAILSAFYTSAPTHGRRRPWHRSARGLACDPRGEARGEIRGRSVSALAQASPQLAQREAETGDNVAAVNYLLTDVASPGFSQVRPPVRAAGVRGTSPSSVLSQ